VFTSTVFCQRDEEVTVPQTVTTHTPHAMFGVMRLVLCWRWSLGQGGWRGRGIGDEGLTNRQQAAAHTDFKNHPTCWSSRGRLLPSPDRIMGRPPHGRGHWQTIIAPILLHILHEPLRVTFTRLGRSYRRTWLGPV